MRVSTPFKKRSERLLHSLSASVAYFRSCDDPPGFEAFINSLDDLENLLEFQQSAGEIPTNIDSTVTVLRELDQCIKNQDVIGLTDVLEFRLYPLTKEWIEEVLTNDCNPGK